MGSTKRHTVKRCRYLSVLPVNAESQHFFFPFLFIIISPLPPNSKNKLRNINPHKKKTQNSLSFSLALFRLCVRAKTVLSFSVLEIKEDTQKGTLDPFIFVSREKPLFSTTIVHQLLFCGGHLTLLFLVPFRWN